MTLGMFRHTLAPGPPGTRSREYGVRDMRLRLFDRVRRSIWPGRAGVRSPTRANGAPKPSGPAVTSGRHRRDESWPSAAERIDSAAARPSLSRPTTNQPLPRHRPVDSPPGGGPQAHRPEAGGPEAGGPQVGGPEAGGPQAGGPQAGGPQAGGPQAGGPPAGGRTSGPLAWPARRPGPPWQDEPSRSQPTSPAGPGRTGAGPAEPGRTGPGPAAADWEAAGRAAGDQAAGGSATGPAQSAPGGAPSPLPRRKVRSRHAGRSEEHTP